MPNSRNLEVRRRSARVALAPVSLHEHAHDVEAIGIVRAAVPVDPHRGGADQLALLAPIHRLDRIAELASATRLYFDERHGAFPLDHQIDVSMPAPKPPLHHTPSVPPEPSLRDLLPQLAELLSGR